MHRPLAAFLVIPLVAHGPFGLFADVTEDKLHRVLA